MQTASPASTGLGTPTTWGVQDLPKAARLEEADLRLSQGPLSYFCLGPFLCSISPSWPYWWQAQRKRECGRPEAPRAYEALWFSFVFTFTVKKLQIHTKQNDETPCIHLPIQQLPAYVQFWFIVPPASTHGTHRRNITPSMGQRASPKDKNLYLASFKGIWNPEAVLISLYPEYLISQLGDDYNLSIETQIWESNTRRTRWAFSIYQLSYKNKVSAFDLNILKALTRGIWLAVLETLWTKFLALLISS